MHQPMDRSQAATVLDRPGHFSSTLPEEAERIFVGLGANLGDTAQTLAAAYAALAALPQSVWVARSSLYRSAPVDAAGPDFLNAVAVLDTRLSAPALLQALQGIEADHGRQRPYRHAPRTLDLDLLLYGDLVIDRDGVQLPRDEITRYPFVLKPLADLAGERLHPVLGQSFAELWENYAGDAHPMTRVEGDFAVEVTL